MTDLYVGFHPRASLRESWRLREWMMFGHVEAWLRFEDGTWLFYDPRAVGTILRVEHRFDEVDLLLAMRFAHCETILRLPYEPSELRWPFHPTMNCAAQVGHLMGVRAYSPARLRSILLSRGAEVIHDAQDAERGPRGEGAARA